MRFDANGGGSVNYEPNSFGGPTEDRSYLEPPLKVEGDAMAYDAVWTAITIRSRASCSACSRPMRNND